MWDIRFSARVSHDKAQTYVCAFEPFMLDCYGNALAIVEYCWIV